jgi:hypothetical protein
MFGSTMASATEVAGGTMAAGASIISVNMTEQTALPEYGVITRIPLTLQKLRRMRLLINIITRTIFMRRLRVHMVIPGRELKTLT